MGRRREKLDSDSKKRSQTLPSSPSHSSSSSDFEFTISISPRKSTSATLCPADELFYKGQLLPLHLSPRISMVRTLLLASSSTTSSSGDTTTASRDSTGSNDSSASASSFNSDLVLLGGDNRYEFSSSSRPSSVADQDDEFRRLNGTGSGGGFHQYNKKVKYFSLTRLFNKKDNSNTSNYINNKNRRHGQDSSSMKRMSASAKEVISKYLKKVKPLYEKLSQKQQQQQRKMGGGAAGGVVTNNAKPWVRSAERDHADAGSSKNNNTKKENSSSGGFSHSFSGNLRYPRRKSCVSSCPSSMRSSPSHSGILSSSGFPGAGGRFGGADTSSMEELQSAIQGAIAHCKNSMNKSMVSNEI